MSSAPVETPAERRRSLQREEARRAILDATEALLIEDGYEQFSMRRLATACGYTAPSIYHHFGDKQGLLDALLEERFDRLLVRLRRVKDDGDPVDTLRAQSAAFVKFSLQYPTHYRLLTDPRPNDVRPPQSVDGAVEALVEPLLALERAGRLRSASAKEAGEQLWVLLHGLISLRINRPDLEWSPDLSQHAIDTMLSGLVAPRNRISAPKRRNRKPS